MTAYLDYVMHGRPIFFVLPGTITLIYDYDYDYLRADRQSLCSV